MFDCKYEVYNQYHTKEAATLLHGSQMSVSLPSQGLKNKYVRQVFLCYEIEKQTHNNCSVMFFFICKTKSETFPQKCFSCAALGKVFLFTYMH